MTESVGVVAGLYGVQRREYANRGIGRYDVSYVNAPCLAHPNCVLGIDLDLRLPEPLGLRTAGCSVVSTGESLSSPPTNGPIVCHVLSAFNELPLFRLWPRRAHSGEVALAVPVYYLIPWRFRDRDLDSGLMSHPSYVRRLSLLNCADALRAISDTAAQDLIELLGIDERRVHTVGGAAPRRTGASGSASLAPGGSGVLASVRTGALLALGCGDLRTNTERLIDAYAGLPTEPQSAHQLVLVGELSTATGQRLNARADRADAVDNDNISGPVSDDELHQIRARSALRVPFVGRGAGPAVLEALEMGMAVLVTDIEPFRQLVPDPAARFDPLSTEAIRAALHRGLSDAVFRDGLRCAAPGWAAPFSWEAVVERSLVACDTAAAASARRVRRRAAKRSGAATPAGRPCTLSRLACLPIVTPLPPTAPGLAGSNFALIQALAALVDVDVYREEDDRSDPFAMSSVRCHPARGFEWRLELGGADLTPLYCVGNSAAQIHAWRGLARHRGNVLLHDVRLTALYQSMEADGSLGWPDLAARMRLIEGRRLDSIDDDDVYLVSEVVDRARRVYLHTDAARAIVLRQRPRRHADVFVVPSATNDADQAARALLALRRGDSLAGTARVTA